MGAISTAIYYAFHPQELRSIVQWKVWHDAVHQRIPAKEDPTLASCFKFLNMTSRSFSAVIQELHPELLVPVTLFYLVLRGLDTIEDDMTLDIEKKEPLLRKFDELMEQDGWTFKESGPDEKDRELLVHFDDVITELKKIKAPYHAIIKDITTRMSNGMADYALLGLEKGHGVKTIVEYEKYCHHVAGLVGQGLTRLFVEAKLANPALLEREELSESMGQFLQKTNIIRDIHEDWEDKRRWWPSEIWSKYFDEWDDLLDPKNRERALHCSSEMVLNALKHIEDCLFYMAGVREQSVFNFVAIPQSMAIATLELVFRNPDVFDKNVKITKGDACLLMLESTQNLRVLCDVFKRYLRRIAKKNDPRDPNFMAISIQCGKIEQFIETIFPIQTPENAQHDYSWTNKEAFVVTFVGICFILALGAIMAGTAYLMGGPLGEAVEEMFGLQLPPLANTSSVLDSVESVPTPELVHGEL